MLPNLSRLCSKLFAVRIGTNPSYVSYKTDPYNHWLMYVFHFEYRVYNKRISGSLTRRWKEFIDGFDQRVHATSNNETNPDVQKMYTVFHNISDQQDYAAEIGDGKGADEYEYSLNELKDMLNKFMSKILGHLIELGEKLKEKSTRQVPKGEKDMGYVERFFKLAHWSYYNEGRKPKNRPTDPEELKHRRLLDNKHQRIEDLRIVLDIMLGEFDWWRDRPGSSMAQEISGEKKTVK